MRRVLVVSLLMFSFCLNFASSPKETKAQSFNPNPPNHVVRLVFIGASTFHDWMGDTERDPRDIFHGNLLQVLSQNKYFVSDIGNQMIYFDSSVEVNGDYMPITKNNIGNFFTLFRGVKSNSVYLPELYSMSRLESSALAAIRSNSGITNPGGTNEIVLFKANHISGKLLGNVNDPIPPISSNPLRGVVQYDKPSVYTVANAKGIYLDLLNYFAQHPEKLFIAITFPSFNRSSAPYVASEAANERAFANWLVNDWLGNYPHNNVAVFDYFNILTHVNNHHRYNSQTGKIEHITVAGSPNYTDPAYSFLEDIHPTREGHVKATSEFVPLLNIYYNRWKGTSGTPTPTLQPTPTPSPVCRADVNKNGRVEVGDISGILFDWGGTCTAAETACRSDVNRNGKVEVGDISGVLFYWGQSCLGNQ